jgi:hypothetical protein
MSRFRLHLRGSKLVPVYDTRFGTATDSSGWITFGLHSGNRRVWLDSSRADDTGDGLSAATAKKTFDAAFAVFTGAGFTSGDQFMIAGGSGGGTYTDNKASGNWTLNNGLSATYPTAVLSYDRADPTNSAKYGKLVGSQMPSITLATTSSSFELSSENGGAANYFFIQGIEFTAANTGGIAINWVLRHNGCGVQNCRFNLVSLGMDNAGSSLGLNQNCHVSKSSFAGQWSSTTAVALYIGGHDGLYWEDNVFAHCGWKIVAGSVNTRGTTGTNGDPNQFSHAFYYHASGINGRAQRILGIDSAHDSLNFRGWVDSNCCVALDDPYAATLGGFSNSYTEAPTGVDQHHLDHLWMGGANMTATSNDGNGGITTNTRSGSYLRNVVAIDNPTKADGFNSLVFPHCDDVNQIDQYLLMDKVRAYQYAAGLETSGTTNNTKIHDSWTNCIVDATTPVSLNTTLTNVSIQNGAVTYPNKLTRDQIITNLLTAIGITPSGTSYLARKSQLVNIALWRPDQPWAQMLIDIAFPAYGAVPSYQTATVPNLSSESPRAVYA